MSRKVLLPALLTLLILTGCGKPKVTCSDESVQKVVKNLVTENTEKKITTELKNNAGDQVLDTAKVRAALNEVKIAIENIRTSKQDPNSTKVFCEATIKYTFSAETLKDADTAAQISKMNMSQAAKSYGFERSADTFSKGITYNAQPTDDGSKVFAELENAKPVTEMLASVVASSLVKPKLEEQARMEEKKKADEAAEMARVQAETEKQQTEQKQATLKLVKTENAMANQQINELWKALPDTRRSMLLEYQRAWIKKKEIDCKVAAAGKSIDPTEKEIQRLRCDTEATKMRTNYLHQQM